MVNNFTLKGITETFHDIENTNDEMGETKCKGVWQFAVVYVIWQKVSIV